MSNHSRISLLFVCAIFILSTSCNKKANIYLYQSEGTHFNFPENSLNLQPTGVCFSGGGTRAMTCAAGQMKALDSLDLWKDVGYISSVSGGSWASSVFTYYRPTKNGPQNDLELLGTPYGVKNLTLSGLKLEVPKKEMIHTVTQDLTGELLELLAEDDLSLGLLEKAHDIWIDGIGHTYLKPFGLYGDGKRYFTLNEASRDDIIKRAPKLKLTESDFYLVHNQEGDAPRPYLVMNSSILAPASLLPLDKPAKMAVFNYSPLGVGTANLLEVKKDSRFSPKASFQIGGGYIEPFAMGGTAPIKRPEICKEDRLCATVKVPVKRRFRLADGAGTSSAAFAGPLAQSIPGDLLSPILSLGSLIPEEAYWAPGNPKKKAVEYRFADGGSLENFGVLTLLQRKVKKIVVFINTDVPIDTTFNPRGNTMPNKKDIDYDFYSLFADFSYGPQFQNQVFSKEDFIKVFEQFKTCIKDGKTVMAKMKTTTQPQPAASQWWGIPAGQEVEILWMYNYTVPKWEEKLSQEIQNELKKKDGLFPNFPWYNTIFPDGPPFLVKFTPEMAKLLYELQFYNVYANAEAFEFLRE